MNMLNVCQSFSRGQIHVNPAQDICSARSFGIGFVNVAQTYQHLGLRYRYVTRMERMKSIKVKQQYDYAGPRQRIGPSLSNLCSNYQTAHI